MSSKPQDFFLGVIDFFSNVLPGAVVTLLLLNLWQCNPLTAHHLLPTSPVTIWIVVAAVSYVIGHFIAAVGSWIFDPFYDRTYKRAMQAGEMIDPKRDFPFRTLLRCWRTVFTKRKDYFEKISLQRCAERYRDKTFEVSKPDVMPLGSIFLWSGCVIRLRSGSATTEIERLQADSKFFRSLALVLLGFAGWVLSTSGWDSKLAYFIVGIALAALSLWRFMYLRWKSTERTYEYYIALMNDLDSKSEEEQRISN